MTTLIFVALLFGTGFFVGMQHGTERGYNQAMGQVNTVIDRLEKFYQEKIDGMERIIRERLARKEI